MTSADLVRAVLKNVSTMTMVIVMAAVLNLPYTAQADSIKNKFGVTGRLGFTVPSDSQFTTLTSYAVIPSLNIGMINVSEGKADPAFVGGGGLIYGATDNFAIEIDVTHSPSIDYEFTGAFGSESFEVTSTDVSLGVQYRFIPESRAVPYVGAGVDIIISDGKYLGRDNLDVETVVGGHFNVGLDFFISKQIALNADFREVLAPTAEIKNRDQTLPYNLKDGRYDPISFIGLFGVRFFFN